MKPWRTLLLEFLALAVLLIPALTGCQADQPHQVYIQVDDSRREVTTEAATVRDVLAEAGVTLNPLDRVNPDLYVEIQPDMEIVVTRVEEQFTTRSLTVPFERKTVVNEALPTGETRLVQLGANGQEEITHRILLEDGVVVERAEVQRTMVVQPVDEIIAVGVEDELAPVSLQGSVAYLSAGNAWLMRENSGVRRPLTTQGDLDGRVFDLSPDGRQLLYSRRLGEDVETPINQLWLVDTTIVGEKPFSLPVRGVLFAGWSPDGGQIAYSTADRTASPPGWRANNDLWLVEAADTFTQTTNHISATQVFSSSKSGVYSWWGANFSWSSDGRNLAYAGADRLSVIDVQSRTLVSLMEFSPYNTYSEWVWTPDVCWSPDGRFFAATVHGPPVSSEDAQDSQVFDLWLLAADGSVQVKIEDQVGMWASPHWGSEGILYGRAANPLQSADSRYDLVLRDRDGSNPRLLFPNSGEPGVEAPPQIAWAPDGETFIFVYNGNLYLGDTQGLSPRQLTSNGQNTLPRWSTNQSTTKRR